ncbi:MAG: 16S rRNA processing protein RimM [Chlorobi bacterium]|nr:16S rRNA processing protein RimM [Chlorobiota bacterium]
MERYLTGTILKPKGLNGEVKVYPVTDYPERFLSRKSCYIGKTGSEAVLCNVVRASLAKGFAWLFFEGIESREAAEAICGLNLYIEEQELQPMPEGRAYLHELIGLAVVDGSGNDAGVVTDVLQMPASEVYEVTMSGGRVVLLPAIEEFIEEIDTERRLMVVPRFEEFL